MTEKKSNPKDLVGVRKAPMSTVPANVLAELGVAMLEGASKYGRHNYRAVGVRASVYYDGTMRHMMDWWEGTDIDPDSGVSHITKAIAGLVVLRDAMMQGMMTDDRPPSSKPFYNELNERAAALVDKYADKNPTHYTILHNPISLLDILNPVIVKDNACGHMRTAQNTDGVYCLDCGIKVGALGHCLHVLSTRTWNTLTQKHERVCNHCKEVVPG